MSLQTYASFVVFAVLLIVVPGPDFAVVTKNALGAGARGGAWAALGVATACAVQGAVAVTGLGAVIVASQPVFRGVKWAGIAYLSYLGVQALRHAVARDAGSALERGNGAPSRAGWRQGFLSNITNPKVLVFYLAVLPQFLSPAAPLWALAALAFTHAALGLAYLLVLVAAVHRARNVLTRRPVRRALDAITGCVLVGFALHLVRRQPA